MDGLDKTFSLFSDDEGSDSCTHCGTEKNLVPYYMGANDTQIWICKGCKVREDEAQRKREQKSQAEIDRWVEMDRWEE